jgi:hypothetical protein
MRAVWRKLESLDLRKLSPTGRRLAVAAAVLVLLTFASPLPLEHAEEALPVGTLADAGVPARTSDVFLESAAPAAPNLNGLDDRRGGPSGPPAKRKEEGSSVRRNEDMPAKSPVQHPAAVTATAIATPVPDETSASGSEILAPAVPELTSLSVVHLHVVGSCQGRLVVSRDGVAFVPDVTKDGFALRYNEFLHTLADGMLTIKSSTRTYRFKAAAAAGEGDEGSQLHDVVASIARFR